MARHLRTTRACGTSRNASERSTSVAGFSGIQIPTHYDYQELRHSPLELRRYFERLGWRRIIGFHTSRPMHKRERELTLSAAREARGHLLLHPVVGVTMHRDLNHFARIKCYQEILRHYPHHIAALSLLPLAVRGAGPREAIWHAIIRRNYGCTDFIVELDHASPTPGAAPRPRRVLSEPRCAGARHRARSGSWEYRSFPAARFDYSPCAGRYVRASGEDAAKQHTEQLLRHRSCRSYRSRGGDPRLVHLPGSARCVANRLSTATGAGNHAVLHRTVGLGQIDARQDHVRQVHRGREACGHAPRRRRGPPPPVERARILQAAPRSERSPHRLRRERDHQERRGRDLCADRAVCEDSPGRAGHGGGPRSHDRDPRLHAARGVRGARSQGALRQGSRGGSSRTSQASATPTRSRRVRSSPSTRRTSVPMRRRRKSSCTCSRRATSIRDGDSRPIRRSGPHRLRVAKRERADGGGGVTTGHGGRTAGARRPGANPDQPAKSPE